MSSFLNAVQKTTNRQAKTTNGAVTLSSSLDPVVDLFFLAGASRGKNLGNNFLSSFLANAELTCQLALWMRDIRGGAGERQQFRDFMQWLMQYEQSSKSKNRFQWSRRLAAKVLEVGRADDLLVYHNTDMWRDAAALIQTALDEKNGLVAKWMPRKGEVAKSLAKYLRLSPKKYRKTIVGLSATVEQKMCARKWDTINFSHVPSRAMSIYRLAFDRNAHEKFQEYVDALSNGETKVNAGAVFPHDIVYDIMNSSGNALAVSHGMWDALPNFATGTGKTLVMADVSGSMGGLEKTNRGPMPMLVSVSLALYFATKTTGPFANHFMTFSSSPSLVKLPERGSLKDKIATIHRSEWGMSTDLQKAFDVILQSATKQNVAADEIPERIVIVSDMEFNSACHNTNFELISKKYAEAGYSLPSIVFWNVNGRSGNVPVTFDQAGTALVSGYSPSIMKSIVETGAVATPLDVMMQTISKERYKL